MVRSLLLCSTSISSSGFAQTLLLRPFVRFAVDRRLHSGVAPGARYFLAPQISLGVEIPGCSELDLRLNLQLLGRVRWQHSHLFHPGRHHAPAGTGSLRDRSFPFSGRFCLICCCCGPLWLCCVGPPGRIPVMFCWGPSGGPDLMPRTCTDLGCPSTAWDWKGVDGDIEHYGVLSGCSSCTTCGESH
jgi:hypothetical protein